MITTKPNKMRVKWNRNLDGNTIIDSNEPLSDYKEEKSTNSIVNNTKLSPSSLIKSSSTIPMRSKNRDNGKSNRGCNLIFGPTRKSTSRSTSATSSTISSSSSTSTSSSSSSPTPPSLNNREQSSSPQPPPPPTSQGSSDSDRRTMTKLSNFLGIFKLTPSNGSIKGSSSKSSSTHPTTIKVVRRASGKNGYENDGLFRTDSRRRRRANSLLQRNSDIRRSWNAAMTGVRPDVSVRGAWLRPGSPNYRPSQEEGVGGDYRSISPSVMGTNNNYDNESGVGNLNRSRPSSSLDGSGHFANSCKVNSMPAPIVTLPECCLEGSDCEGNSENVSFGTVGVDPDDYHSSSKPEIDLEIEHHLHHLHHHHNNHSNGCDEVDQSPNNINDKIGNHNNKINQNQHQHINNNNNNNNKQNGSIVRPTGPPPPPPTSLNSVTHDESLRSVDDVFIQVQITASSTKCKLPDHKQSTPNKTINNRLTGKNQQSTHYGIVIDESDRPLSPIFESCTERVSYEESISPTGSLTDSRLDSRSSGEVEEEEEEEDVNTFLTNRPPSSTAGSSSSTEMTLSEDGGLGESISYDASSGCSWETSSILTGSVCLSPDGSSSNHHSSINNNRNDNNSERMSPSSPSPTSPIISTSTPQSHHHHHQPTSSMISDQVLNHPNSNPIVNNNTTNDETYLYEPARMSEVIRVTIKKAEIPELVTLRSEDIIDLDTTGSIEENGSPSSPSSFSSSSISSVQRISCNSNGVTSTSTTTTSGGGTNRKSNRTGILKDSNHCLNSNGLHNCRSSTTKKVHFAESAKIRTTAAINSPINNEVNHNLQSANYDNQSSPLPLLTNCYNQFPYKPDKSAQLIRNNETTITTSSSVTISKPSLSPYLDYSSHV